MKKALLTCILFFAIYSSAFSQSKDSIVEVKQGPKKVYIYRDSVISKKRALEIMKSNSIAGRKLKHATNYRIIGRVFSGLSGAFISYPLYKTTLLNKKLNWTPFAIASGICLSASYIFDYKQTKYMKKAVETYNSSL